MSDEVIAWIQKAESDFQNARILLRQRKTFLPDNICWSCQQSADAVATLDQFGTDIRYPGVSATPKDARQSFDALRKVRAFVRAKLALA